VFGGVRPGTITRNANPVILDTPYEIVWDGGSTRSTFNILRGFIAGSYNVGTYPRKDDVKRVWHR